MVKMTTVLRLSVGLAAALRQPEKERSVDHGKECLAPSENHSIGKLPK